MRCPLESLCNLLLRLLHAHAVEKARIDYAAVAFICGVGDDEGVGLLSWRAHHWRVAEAVFVGEVEAALVVCRAAEDRARAVVHHHEIGDIDRKLPVRVEGVESLHAGVETLLLGGIYQLLCSAVASAFRDECRECGVLGCRGGGERMIGRKRPDLAPQPRTIPPTETLR